MDFKYRAWLLDFEDNKWKMVYGVFPGELQIGRKTESTALWGDSGFTIPDECKAIMQSTGRKDDDKQEIYEKDIVEAATENTKYKWEVSYMEHYGAFMLIRSLGDGKIEAIQFSDVNHGSMKVLGNLYEHRDLLN